MMRCYKAGPRLQMQQRDDLWCSVDRGRVLSRPRRDGISPATEYLGRLDLKWQCLRLNRDGIPGQKQ
jgi:hypothetical protein